MYSSSCSIYGEQSYLPIDEKHPKNPESFYAHTKLAVENMLPWYSRLKSINYAALRYFNPAGYDAKGRVKGIEKDCRNLIPIAVTAALGLRDKIEVFGSDYATHDGTCIRDYVHVSDVARAHIHALKYVNENKRNIEVNLGAGRGYSVLEVLQDVAQCTGHRVPYEYTSRRSGDPEKLIASNEYARKTLNWEPLYSDLRTMVKSTWDHYRNKSEF